MFGQSFHRARGKAVFLISDKEDQPAVIWGSTSVPRKRSSAAKTKCILYHDSCAKFCYAPGCSGRLSIYCGHKVAQETPPN